MRGSVLDCFPPIRFPMLPKCLFDLTARLGFELKKPCLLMGPEAIRRQTKHINLKSNET